jgi:Tol biopolymer transport system component
MRVTRNIGSSARGHLQTAAFTILASGMACLAHGAPGDTQLISVTSSIPHRAAGYSSDALGTVVSYGGRYVVFESGAKNLVPGPSSAYHDIFLRDRKAHRTERVSVALNGAQTNGDSLDPSISANGRYVAFTSTASNLAPDNDPGRFGGDIFVRDRDTGQTELVSVSSSGEQANQSSQAGSISSDGRYVVFSSYATNLAPGIDNGWANVFVHDRQTGQTEWISVGLNGKQPNNTSQNGVGPRAISADGRYVVFWSEASNLVPGDTNGVADVFVRDRQTQQTARVSVKASNTQANGASGNPGLSADGRFVVFASDATNLVPGDTNGVADIFIRDRQAAQTERVNVDSVIATSSFGAQRLAMSADARIISFDAQGFGGRYDVYAVDRQTGRIEQASVSSSGAPGNDQSVDAGLSADGRVVVFSSLANNLVPNDHNTTRHGTNAAADMYVHELAAH